MLVGWIELSVLNVDSVLNKHQTLEKILSFWSFRKSFKIYLLAEDPAIIRGNFVLEMLEEKLGTSHISPCQVWERFFVQVINSHNTDRAPTTPLLISYTNENNKTNHNANVNWVTV